MHFKQNIEYPAELKEKEEIRGKIRAILQDIDLKGRNDSEFDQINTLLARFDTIEGSLEYARIALKEAQEILDRKQFH